MNESIKRESLTESTVVTVSIIAPAFNNEDSIEDFIKCIVRQHYKNWELIIVDDGSTDRTIDIVKEYEKKDNRIKLLIRNRMPKGSATCRNIGQKFCKGKYFMHLDSDDIVEEHALMQRVNFMELNNDCDFATFKGESIIVENNRIIKTGQIWGIPPYDGDLLKAFLSVKYPFSVWNNIYKSTSFKNYLWDEKIKIYTDFSYIVPSLLLPFKHYFAIDSKVDYLYKIGQTKAMTSNFLSEDKYESTKYLFSKTMQQLKNTKEYNKYKSYFKHFYNLQLKRVVIERNENLYMDYIGFINLWYGKTYAIKAKIFYNIIKYILKGPINNMKIINGVYYLMFEPNELIARLYKKVI